MTEQTATPTFVDETTAARVAALTERVAAVEKVAVCAHEDGEASDLMIVQLLAQQGAVIAQLNETTRAVNYLAKQLSGQATELAEKLAGVTARLEGAEALIKDTRDGLDAALEGHGHPDVERRLQVAESLIDAHRYRLDDLEKRA